MLTMSTFLITFLEVLIKNPLNGGFFYVHVCYSPRDTALRSVPELKQFMCKNARTFLKLHQPFHQFISANNKPTIGSRQFQP
ncbi:hypothetical protein BMS56_05490 [Salmonella enterica]|uniref:Uncharacterized protein n=4 Tax=Salmonella enterica TaxID=28901 RepID=A0A3V4P6R2_SALET|nr:hypothetical protein [Salmonella enterica subsp. enterica serovar Cerro]EAA8590549.1 hypothetical protein [Salmonella enterica]EAU8721929.1 hypothetical protein [Salmonella enterica subsp. enterica serovar Montevideo]EAW1970930.1 hypothetical protein [Salmonella enterica subsp. enterica]EBB4443447.1 hypothetical protein [Salmonella enterica subsp. enterica serovar Dublin]EBJ7217691.1 hypothetical protein [Salmonella enterica subsp. enterica serovar 3,10:e,h:-]EBK2795192.1 hypothetical prot